MWQNLQRDMKILYTKDVMIKDGIIHLPLYMAELL